MLLLFYNVILDLLPVHWSKNNRSINIEYINSNLTILKQFKLFQENLV